MRPRPDAMRPRPKENSKAEAEARYYKAETRDVAWVLRPLVPLTPPRRPYWLNLHKRICSKVNFKSIKYYNVSNNFLSENNQRNLNDVLSVTDNEANLRENEASIAWGRERGRSRMLRGRGRKFWPSCLEALTSLLTRERFCDEMSAAVYYECCLRAGKSTWQRLTSESKHTTSNCWTSHVLISCFWCLTLTILCLVSSYSHDILYTSEVQMHCVNKCQVPTAEFVTISPNIGWLSHFSHWHTAENLQSSKAWKILVVLVSIRP